MRNPHGYAYLRDRFSGKEEGADVFTCSHCNSVREVPPGKTPGGWCTECGSYICTSPACNNGCVPFMRKVEAAERRGYLRRNFMRAAGLD